MPIYNRVRLIPALTCVLAGLSLVMLAGLYAAALQTHISGSFQETSPASTLKNEYIKDVSEIQVALNVWGTIHHTGYPLFAIVGNLFTAPWRLAGLEPAAAASLYAMAWGALALASLGVLIARLTGRPRLAVLSVVLLGVMRSIWLHHVIAEVYSMSLALTGLLILAALWPVSPQNTHRRLMLLAALGGIGVAHHRAVLFVLPGIAWAVWPELWPQRRQWRHLAPRLAGLALLGFLPYFYLPLRAWQHGSWVYGEPGTLRGLWIEFSGREAAHLVKAASSPAQLWDNLAGTWDALVHEMTLPGLIIALVGLVVALTRSPHRRAARAAALCGLGPLLFTLVFHTAVLPQAILIPVLWALVLEMALATDAIARRIPRSLPALLVGAAAWSLVLAAWHYSYIHEVTSEPTGQHMIERLARVPREGKPALMLPWGPRYAAASYARLVTGEYRDLLIVDHKADYRHLLAEGYWLYTEPDTFYTFPPPWPSAYGAPSAWWSEHLGPLYLTSAAPGFVRIMNAPWLTDATDAPGVPLVGGIERRAAWLTCDPGAIYLHVLWGTNTIPTNDPSIFVHLTGDTPAPNPPNADLRHPVYGAYPFSRWSPGEIVRDDFTLPRLPDKTQVRFGLYERDAAGQFVNYGETSLAVAGCQPIP